MSIIILLALILLSGGLALILRRRRIAVPQPGRSPSRVSAVAPKPRELPDNVIRVLDWGAALQHRRHRTGLSTERAARPAG